MVIVFFLIEIDPCAGNTACLNGGTCSNVPGSVCEAFQCLCPGCTTGTYCEQGKPAHTRAVIEVFFLILIKIPPCWQCIELLNILYPLFKPVVSTGDCRFPCTSSGFVSKKITAAIPLRHSAYTGYYTQPMMKQSTSGMGLYLEILWKFSNIVL